MDRGHWVTFSVRSGNLDHEDASWYRFDDEKVSKVAIEDVMHDSTIHKNASVLLYVNNKQYMQLSSNPLLIDGSPRHQNEGNALPRDTEPSSKKLSDSGFPIANDESITPAQVTSSDGEPKDSNNVTTTKKNDKYVKSVWVKVILVLVVFFLVVIGAKIWHQKRRSSRSHYEVLPGRTEILTALM